MKRHYSSALVQPVSRRTFIKTLAIGGLIAGSDAFRSAAWAETDVPYELPVLRGPEFNLAIEPVMVDFTGVRRPATAVNGSIPGPVLRWREGDHIRINVANRLPVSTSIHWHGILVPAPMDGVPGISFPGIPAGQMFSYHFKVKQSGTYWYHSHTGFQEQTGLYGPLVIEPLRPDPFKYDRDYVVFLSDWTNEKPEAVFAKLKKQSDYYNFHQKTVDTFFDEVKKKGWGYTVSDWMAWGKMRMSPRDISDVTGHTYTYLMNGNVPGTNWTGLFRRGEKVRLRVINGSSMTYFDVRIPGLKMTVVQADGQNVEPVPVDEFRIAVAETFDVIVEPSDDRAYTIFAQAIDRSGYARGTLAPRPGMAAPVPPMDPRPVLTMTDMGMAGMDMSGSGKTNNPQAGSGQGNMSGMNMTGMSGGSGGGDMKGMDMSGGDMKGMDMSGGKGPQSSPGPVMHRGPGIDNVAMNPINRLNDPGEGLENNGRKVLTYADLRSVVPGQDRRDPDRELVIHLTGNMMRYIWSFNGIKYDHAKPIEFRHNERLRIKLINDTMMNHPIHLHGMFTELENGQGRHLPRKHTVNVMPGSYLTYLLTADALGGWAYHCHLLYHMEAGMFRKVVVS